MTITAKNVSKQYRDFSALKDVSLTVRDGELVALLGPSGSGKTTLLRIIAGLEKPDNGSVVISGGKSGRHPVGFVFQHYALFKHLTVFENIAFGLRVRRKKERLSEDAIRRKVMKLLNLVHLEALHGRYPSQLSGGQRQRVALARALAVEPAVLLLDEPFGALDAKVRKELRRWMRRLHEELHITTVFVTHDQEEAMEMADRVVVLNQGRIEQQGTPEEVYLSPTNAFVYDFLGHYNEFDAWQMQDGTLLLKDSEEGIRREKQLADGDLPLAVRLLGAGKLWRMFGPPKKAEVAERNPSKSKSGPGATPVGAPVKVFCRPHELFVHTDKEPGTVAAEVVHINPAGPLVKLELERPNGDLLDAELPRAAIEQMKLSRGQKVYVRPKQQKVFA